MPRTTRLDKPLEWYPWNPQQWGASKRVQRMTWAQRGLYRELLDEYYLKRGLPSDPQALADILGEDLENIGHDLSVVIRCFEVQDDRLVSRTMEEVIAEQLERRIARANRKRSKEGHTPDDRNDGDPGPVGPNMEDSGPVGTSGDQLTGPSVGQLVPKYDGTTRTGQDRTGQKITTTTTPPASGGAVAGDGAVKERKRHRTRKDVLADLGDDGIPVEVIEGGKEILAFWRKRDPDGREIRCEADLLIPRLDAISKRQPRFSIDVLVEAGRNYCASDRKRHKAAQYFFSLQPDPDSEKPPFYEFARAVIAKRDLAASKAKGEPQPQPEPQSIPFTAPAPTPILLEV